MVDELIAENFTVRPLHATAVGAAGPPVGREVVRQGYRRNTAAFPDYHVTIEELIAEGDRVVMYWTHRGTHRGDFLGVPAAGKEIRGTAVGIYRVVGGKIAEVRALWDRAEVWQQLGPIPDTETVLSGARAENEGDDRSATSRTSTG